MAIPEWKLDETAESYRFSNVNPKLVFLLALVAALVAVSMIYLGLVTVNVAIDSDLIPFPPRLQGLVD